MPVAFSAPAVGWQPGGPVRAWKDRVPVGGDAGAEELAQRGQQRPALTLTTLQGRQHETIVFRVTQALHDGDGQHRMGADFDERVVPVVGQSTDRLGEEHRVTHVAPPVLVVELQCVGRRVWVHARVEGQLDGVRLHHPYGIETRLVQGLEQSAVRRHIHLHAPHESALAFELGEDLVQQGRFPGEHRGLGAVAASGREAISVPVDVLLRLIIGELGGDHGAEADGRSQHLGALAGDSHGIGQSDRAGGLGRRYLTEAMAHHRVGHDAPGLPQSGETELHRGQHGLNHLDLIEAGGIGGGLELVENGPVQVLLGKLIPLLDGRGEDGLGREQLQSHPQRLRSLSGEDEHQAAASVDRDTSVE